MRYVIYKVRLILLVALAVFAGRFLGQRIGIGPALGAFALFATLTSLLGGYLLKTSTVSQVTWKNRVASYLVPWGWSFSGGKLGRALVASGIIWMLLGTVGVMLSLSRVSMPVSAPTTGGPILSNVVMGLLALAWIIDGGVVLYLISVIAKNFSVGSSQAMSVFKVMGICLLILGASVAAFMLGHPMKALIIAGGPPVAVGACFGLFALIILMNGKNLRWN